MPPPALHALPGMGADRRMFPTPWTDLPGFRAHDWSGHQHARTLPELAESVCRRIDVHDGDILIGASLGGMVALEISRLRRIPAVFLIGSAVHPAEIRRLPAEAQPLIDLVPMRLACAAAAHFSGPLMQMFADSHPLFLRRMCHAILHWQGGPRAASRIYRLHGRGDLLISPRTPVDCVLDGRHALALSHAADCARFVKDTLTPQE